jgi:hypothetical protein
MPDDLTVVDSQPLPDLKVVDSAPLPKPGMLDRANEFAGKALAGAGLPTSISNIPDWFHHLTGQAKDSEPFWAPIREAIKNPTQENIVNAVPFVGPAAVSMSKDVKQGNYAGAAGTLAGTVATPVAASEVRPGMAAGKAELAEATRTPDNKLTPTTRALARLATGGALEATGIPGAGIAGTVSGVGPALADRILPRRPTVPNFYEGAYSDFTGESGKPVPITKSPNYDPAAFKAGVAERTTQPVAVTTPQSVKLSDLAASSEGRPATWTNDTVKRLASWGDPDAMDQARLRGFGTIPKNYSSVELNPKSVTRFDASGNPVNEAAEPNYIYRARDVGEEGIPADVRSPAHATSSLEQAQQFAEQRGKVTGKPQEVVRYDANKLQPGDVTTAPFSSEIDWYKFHKPIPENHVEVVPSPVEAKE